MGKTYLFLWITGLLCSHAIGSAQEPVRVSDPRILFRDNILQISYDIVNSTPEDYFVVSLQVTDAGGRRIYASALSGDIGNAVRGGAERHIHWDLAADHIYRNEKISVELFVVSTLPPDKNGNHSNGYASLIPGQEILAGSQGSPGASSKNYSTAGLVIQSLALPGLGLSRLTGKPHWLRGLAGYGCLAGALVMNRQSYHSYQEIEEYVEFEGKYDQLQKSIQQDNISEVLAYAAVGIWVTDIIWTLAGISSHHRKALQGEFGRITVRPGMDPLTHAPVVGFRYNF